MGLFDIFRKKKKASKSVKPKSKAKKTSGKKSDVRKIYKTTDGYFTQDAKNKKPRSVAVIKQRKDDGAIAVCKIHSKEGKDEKRKVQGLVLSPKKHKSLKVDSVVSSNPIVATKGKDGKFKAIHARDFEPTKDKLNKKEHRHIMENLGGGIEKHKATNAKLLKDWENHFKK